MKSINTMPYFTYRLHVKGSFSQKGFGFSCMQLAYKNDITGTLFYESASSVILEITGNDEDIHQVIEKCKQAKCVTEIHILNKTTTTKKQNDFIMLNQID
ncbi:MAG: acylphosphatase [Bacteroidales bacterium]